MKTIICTIVFVVLSLFPFAGRSQDCLDCGPGDEPIDTPIDGGLLVLIAAGVGFGLRKMYTDKAKMAGLIQE